MYCVRRRDLVHHDFGKRAPTIPVADGTPGEELHIDTGWMTFLEPDAHGRRRRFRAWIFTPHVSRYRFVYPCFEGTTASAIEACEAAWEFYGGVFGVVVPDRTRAIVHTADPRKPRLVDEFLEYAQARGSTWTRRDPGTRRTRRAPSAPCAMFATTASPARSCSISTMRVGARVSGVDGGRLPS